MNESSVPEVVGIPLGILIGVVTALVMVLVLRSAFSQARTLRAVFTVCGQMLALPAFWFGGPWATGILLEPVNRARILPSYIISLTITFLVLTSLPILNAVVRVGADINRRRR